MANPKVSVVVTAHNYAKHLPQALDSVLAQTYDDWETIVVDDGSTDDTGRVAEEAGARVVRHPVNLGNGAAVKSGMRAAKGDWWVLMDGDGQHDPEDLVRILEGLEEYDMVVGARTKGRGTGIHKNLANRVYNWFASYVTAKRIPDLTSGYRAMRASVVRRFIYLLPNTFSYPTTITLAFFRTGHSVKYEPIEAAPRAGKSRISVVKDGFRFFYIILRIATFFSPFRVFFPACLASALLGLGWYAYTFATQHRFTNMSMLLIMQAVILFALALISEQIAQLRFDRSEDDR